MAGGGVLGDGDVEGLGRRGEEEDEEEAGEEGILSTWGSHGGKLSLDNEEEEEALIG